MAGSNYSVNITLDTSKVEGKLKGLEKRVATFRQNLAKPLKISAQTQKLEEKKLKMQDAQRASMIQTRKIGDLIQKQEEQGLKVDKARAHIRRAAVLDNQKLFKAAEIQRKLAVQELKAEQETTKQLAKQTQLQKQLASGKFATIGPGGIGPQLAPMQGPAMGPTSMGLNFDKRTGKLLRGRAGSSPNTRANLLRRFDTQSALISGGFPLLFGQGPIGALAGGLGGGIGGMFGQMGGFAGGIAATAALQTITNAISGVRQFGEGLQDIDGALATVTEKSLFSSEATEKRAAALKKLGKQEELAKLLTQELTITLGKDGLQRVQALGKSSKELARTFGQLGASLQAVLAKVILPAINALNTILKTFTVPSQFKNFRDSLSGTDLERFDEIAASNMTDKVRRGKGKTIGKQLTVAGKADTIAQALAEGIGGGESAFTTASDPTIAASLQERIDFLNRSLEVGREKAELERKIADFKKKGTDLSEVELEKQLVQINQLEKLEALYHQIGSTVRDGLVDAIDSAITGTKSLGEIASSVFAQLRRSLVQFGVTSILGAFGLPGLATGGPAKAGKSYIVGEKGPELFTPGVSGKVTPNDALGGSTNIVVNVDASGSSVESNPESARKFGDALAIAIQSELIKQRRPGGLLR